jgi:isopentenyl diphosphate isomerase/L-lactate dehydrogenase-like FMN-dependent dehydrogenase
MGYVFVSYEERDCDFAKELMLRLKYVGIPVWEQGNITHVPAERYAQIDQAIRNASALIVVMTPEAKASDLNFVQTRGKQP